ncbi:hypothetical protein [Rhizobium sp. BR 314]|uniref:hypothetical protein n=1 Tax=Rhizobium sp. BR 314 TaxID=3040013 RepID=UPI0039BEFE9B
MRQIVLLASATIVVFIGTRQADAGDWPATMTDLGALGGTFSDAYAVSADGTVIVGDASLLGYKHAASWINGAVAPTDLGTLPGSNISQANAVSGDGSVIVGYANNAVGNQHAVSWLNGATIPIDLGTLGGISSQATAVSANGSVIVGIADNLTGHGHAVSWQAGGPTIPTDLGTLGGNSSQAYAVSANGSVIVGAAITTAGYTHAASWSNGTTTPTDLGSLGGPNSYAYAVSANGNVIVGSASHLGYQHAAIWTNGATTPTDLGTLGGNLSQAVAASADGSVIVGNANTATGYTHAASWTNGATAPTDLGSLGGPNSYAYAVSANGNVIVGSASLLGYQHAAVWANGATTPTDLGTLGGNFSQANSVSADGSVVVGVSKTAVGYTRAFVVRLPGVGNGGGSGGNGGGNGSGNAGGVGTQPSVMQDLGNLYLSVPNIADASAIAFDRQVSEMGSVLGAQCRAAAGSHWCLSTSLSGFTVSDQQNALTGTMALGYGITDQIAVGGTIAMTAKGRISGKAFNIDAAPSFGLWSHYSAGGAVNSGFQADLAIGYDKTHAFITRGLSLDNVVPVAGSAGLSTFGARAGIGYGFVAGDWLLTPSASIDTYRMDRSAYNEDTDADFPIGYGKLSGRLTTATFSLGGSRPISEHQSISLQAGVVTDLDHSVTGLTGTSSIPGRTSFTQPETLDRNNVRPFLAGSYSFAIGTRSTVSVAAGVSRASYGNAPAVGLNVGFNAVF